MSELEDLIAQGVVEASKKAKRREDGEPLAWEVRTPDGGLHALIHRDQREWADPEATARRMAGVIGGYVVGLNAPQDGEREDGEPGLDERLSFYVYRLFEDEDDGEGRVIGSSCRVCKEWIHHPDGENPHDPTCPVPQLSALVGEIARLTSSPSEPDAWIALGMPGEWYGPFDREKAEKFAANLGLKATPVYFGAPPSERAPSEPPIYNRGHAFEPYTIGGEVRCHVCDRHESDTIHVSGPSEPRGEPHA